MEIITDFAVKDTYTYLHGFNNYHRSESIPDAIPPVNNSPQKPPYGLRTERISNASFVAPREKNYQTWLYRVTTSMEAGTFSPLDDTRISESANPPAPQNLAPNSYMWGQIPLDDEADWLHQKLLGRNGNPQEKSGAAIWLFSVTRDMPRHTAFSSLDGETLIVPQAGSLDIQTELGRILVRQNEIAVIPRCVRYRVALRDGKPARGYICELFEGHFQLPVLGIIGSTGLANVRDFQVPVASFDGELVDGKVVRSTGQGEVEWRIVSRLNGRLWACEQNHTPFDVVAWHGTCYPYKYDLARFCALGNTRFDHHDPSLFTVLTAPAYGKPPGTAVLDFAIIPPRWQAAKDTLWIPYYHRNVMQEFFFPIISSQSPEYPFNDGGNQFAPFACGLHGSMATHGSPEHEFMEASTRDTSKPALLDDTGITVALLETERPLLLSDWAYKLAYQNMNGQKKKKKNKKDKGSKL
ncbi:homogentisate 1,2-dioxygenase [Poronia punctata]|nr:homogentisate 1,2-dioxygenase [Poronia punctata]